MAINTAIVRQAARTTTGTQDFTSSGFGTPKAAIFIATNATTDGTVTDHAFLGMGFTDGTRSRCISQNNQHNVTSTAHRKWNKSQVLCFSPAGSQSEDIEADFSAWITDGVRINYTAAAGAYLITCVLLSGDDLTAYVNHIGLQNTTPLTIDVTDPGFEPDIVLTMVCESVAIDDSNGQSWNESGYGVVHNNGAGTITQRCIYTFESGGQSTSDVDSWLSDDNGAMSRDPIVDWSASFHTFDSSGFSIDINDDGGNTTDMPYMALKFANHNSGVITHTTPTSTGNKADTGFGFKPQFVMMGMTWVETADTQTGGNNGGVQGLSVFNATNEFSHAYAVEDGQTTTDTQSISDNTAVKLPGGDGTTEIAASFVSFDTNGFTLNYSDVEANAKLFFAWAVEESSTGYTITCDAGSYSQTGTTTNLEYGRKLAADAGSYTLTGTDANLEYGRVMALDAGSYTLTGTDATLTKGYKITCNVGSYALTGTDAALLADRTITAEAGAYTLTGTDATLSKGFTLTVDAGSYALAGTDASLLVGRSLTADPGSYTLLGTDVILQKGFTLTVDVGSYTLTGTDTSLLAGRVITAAAGAYTLTGTDVTLTYSGGGYTLTCDAGSYTLTGTTISLLADRTITAAAGSYTLTGTNAALYKGFTMTAAAGAYTLTGTDAGLLTARLMTAAVGAYTLAGTDAGLLHNRLLTVDSGGYNITGIDAGLLVAFVLVAGGGSYTLTGTTTALNYSGAVSAATPQGRILAIDADTRVLAIDSETRVLVARKH